MTKKPDNDAAYDARAEADITLDFPVEHEGVSTDSLTMRRPKMSDRIWVSKQGGTDEEKLAKLMARLCNVGPELIAKLDDVDSMKVDKQYGAFRGDGAA